jgi:hypothetical protein
VPRGPRPLFAALAIALVAVACDGGEGNEVKTQSTTTSTDVTSTTSTTSSTGACSLPGSTTDPKTASSAGEVALLTDVRTGSQPCADRVVFDFRGGAAPGFTVEYQPGPFTFGESGAPLTIAGSAFLVVRLEPASGVDLTDAAATPTYDGPPSIVPTGLTHVREIRRVSDFEAQLVWVIGLDAAQPFTVDSLIDPARVYVDIAR